MTQQRQPMIDLLATTLYKFVHEKKPTFISMDFSLWRDIGLAAKSDLPVLIIGPTGTGKEMVARLIGESGDRGKNFKAINCALIPQDKIYEELFGVEGGAFTGVPKTREGVFKAAVKGSLFLDEIGDLPPDAQAGLLRVLETGEIKRLGQEEKPGKPLDKVDVRIIAATNQDITDKEKFREELFHRLRVITLFLPPLSENRFIIPYLLKQFLLEEGVKIMDFHFFAFCLCNEWKGNVRELRNFCKYAALNQADGRVRLCDLNSGFFERKVSLPDDCRAYFASNLPFCAKAEPDLADTVVSIALSMWPFWGKISDEMKTYLLFVKHIRTDVLKREGWLPDMKSQPGRYSDALKVKIKTEKHPVIEDHEIIWKRSKVYSYPDIHLEDIPDWYPSSEESDKHRSSKEAIFVMALGSFVLRHFWSYVAKSSRHTEPEPIKPLAVVEREYWENILRSYPGKINYSEIVRVTGVSARTVKRKLAHYSV